MVYIEYRKDEKGKQNKKGTNAESYKHRTGAPAAATAECISIRRNFRRNAWNPNGHPTAIQAKINRRRQNRTILDIPYFLLLIGSGNIRRYCYDTIMGMIPNVNHSAGREFTAVLVFFSVTGYSFRGHRHFSSPAPAPFFAPPERSFPSPVSRLCTVNFAAA